MALLTKAEAARQLGISRTTLYKLIAHGTLSPTPEGLIDTAELGRVLSTLHVHPAQPYTPVDVHAGRPRTLLDTARMDTDGSGSEHRERPALTSSAHPEQVSSERQVTSTYRDLVDILREQLHAAQEREREYQEHIAQLTTMLHEAHQQHQRLLDLPRMPPPSHQEAPGATQPPRRPARPPGRPDTPQAPLGDPRGAMRQRIVALLQDHPEGLSPAEMRDRLGVERSLADTCLGMRRDGLVQRVAFR
jgi:hypothetical protein